MFRAPTHAELPPLRLMVADIPATEKQMARHLGIAPRTLRRHIKNDEAPRPVMLAMFWETGRKKSSIKMLLDKFFCLEIKIVVVLPYLLIRLVPPGYLVEHLDLHWRVSIPYNPRGNASHDCVIRSIFRYHSPRGSDYTVSNVGTICNDCISPEQNIVSYYAFFGFSGAPLGDTPGK